MEKDVHTEHCCKIHGCKYGDDEPFETEEGEVIIMCSVVSGRKKQSHPCEECRFEQDEENYIDTQMNFH